MSKEKTVAEMAEEYLQELEDAWLDRYRADLQRMIGGMEWQNLHDHAMDVVRRQREERRAERHVADVMERHVVDVTSETKKRDALACVQEWIDCPCFRLFRYIGEVQVGVKGCPHESPLHHLRHAQRAVEEALR